MIEIVIDFNKMLLKKEEFILELCNTFNIGRVYGWDAFRDNFADIFCKVPPKDYIYKDNDEWEWQNHYDYIECVKEWNEIGPKDRNGEKGDMKLILKNFYPFLKEYKNIASTFLEIILEQVNDTYIKPSKKDEFRDYYTMVVCIYN